MLKLVGSLCILGGGGLVWWMQMADGRRELEVLSDLLAALGEMGEEIRMTRTPLPLLLDRLCRGRTAAVTAFFSESASAARRGESVSQAWQAAAGKLPLDAEDRRTMAEAGVCLTGDEDHILQGLPLAQARISRSLEEKRSRRPERERRVTALSFSAAALLVILLI